MYVLCTLAFLTLHNFFKNRHQEPSQRPEAERQDEDVAGVWVADGCGKGSVKVVERRAAAKRRRGVVRDLSHRGKQVQVRRWRLRRWRLIQFVPPVAQ